MAEDKGDQWEAEQAEARAILRSAHTKVVAAQAELRGLLDSGIARSPELREALGRLTESRMWMQEHGHGGWIES